MATKIYAKGNYLIAEDTSVNLKHEMPKNLIRVTINENDSTYKLSGLVANSLLLSEIQKENGTAYTQNEWDTFWSENTGGFKAASGGSGAVDSVNGQTGVVNITKASLGITDISKYKHVANATELASAITAGDKLLELTPNGIYTITNQALTSGVKIKGNGATISPIDSNSSVFNLFQVNDVRIDNVIFKGQVATANNLAYNKNHFAINIARSFRPIISNCTFLDFTGGGIGMVGSASDDYKEYGALITNNEFNRCFIGNLRSGRYEFGRDANNRYNNCRIAIWDEAGNWSTTDTKATSSRNPYISTNKAIDYTANGINAFVANSAHGTITGFEGNHANDEGANAWSTNNTITLVGGATYAPNGGIVMDGILPPTMNGFTLYYCNFSLLNRAAMARPTKINGVVASTCTISADVVNVLEVNGFTDHTNVTLTNVVVTEEKIATASQLGQIKVGAGVSVAPDGTISVVSGGRSTTNISAPTDEYGYNSQLGTGIATAQGWTEVATNALITDPTTSGFAGTTVLTDGGIETMVFRDFSTTLNPVVGVSFSAQQKQAMYTNGATFKMKWKPFTIANGNCGIIGLSFGAVAGFAGWTGTNTVNQWYILPTTTVLAGNLATVDWKWNNTVLTQTNFDMSIYHDLEVRMFPAQNKINFFVDGVQVGGDLTWGTIAAVAGANFNTKLYMAGGSGAGTTIGMWVRKMAININNSLGTMITPLLDSDSVFTVPNDWRDYILEISDQAYSKFATIKGIVNLPTGRMLTIRRANSNVLINDSAVNIVVNGNGTKQNVNFTQLRGSVGKEWIQD